MFMQVDQIKHERPPDDVPPWEPTDEPVKEPVQEPVIEPVKDPVIEPVVKPAIEPVLNPARPKRQKTWGDIRADKEQRAQELIEERLKESHANKLMMDRIKNPSGGVTFKQDEEGMNKAYADTTYPGVYYDQNTRTMYVKGTVDAQDWWDDGTKIPVWGDLHDSRQYKDSERACNDLLQKGFPIDRVVGHSLGGAVALQQQKDKNIDFSRTFGAPVWDPAGVFHRGTVERYRHPLDPVSVFDRGATWGSLKAYSHTYGSFQDLDNKSSA